MSNLKNQIIKVFENIKGKFDNDEIWIQAYSDGIITKGELDAYQLEKIGGECPICKKKWKRIEWKNRLAEGYYFKQDCTCYPICYYCNRLMIAEALEGLPDCVNCFYSRTSDTWIYHLCRKLVDKEIEKNGKTIKLKNQKERCKGNYKLIISMGEYVYKCDKCGDITRRR